MSIITYALIAIPAAVTGALGGYRIVSAGPDHPQSVAMASALAWADFENVAGHAWEARKSLKNDYENRLGPNEALEQLALADWTSLLEACNDSLGSSANDPDAMKAIGDLVGEIENFITREVCPPALKQKVTAMEERIRKNPRGLERETLVSDVEKLTAEITAIQTRIEQDKLKLEGQATKFLATPPENPSGG